MRRAERQPSIGDYALIGDGRSAALVSRDGSIDWLCWPRFDSPAVFAALLDPERGGQWQICPATPFRTSRSYLPDSNVLSTRFETATGEVQLLDFMAVAEEEEKKQSLVAEHELVRILECTRGEVQLQLSYEPRPDFARSRRPLRRAHRRAAASGRARAGRQASRAANLVGNVRRRGVDRSDDDARAVRRDGMSRAAIAEPPVGCPPGRVGRRRSSVGCAAETRAGYFRVVVGGKTRRGGARPDAREASTKSSGRDRRTAGASRCLHRTPILPRARRCGRNAHSSPRPRFRAERTRRRR